MRTKLTTAMTALFIALIAAQMTHARPLRRWLEGRSVDMAAAGNDGSASISLPAGTTVLRGLAYGNDPKQSMDVYLPPHVDNAPVIFMVHGGAWMFGDKKAAGVVQNKIARWLPDGFIFVSVDYPMLPQHDALDQAGQVAHALAFAQSHAREWGGDPRKFVLMGHSAGAHLVALLAAAPAKAYAAGAQPWLGTVSLDSAALDVEQIMDSRHLPFYDRAFGRDRNHWRAASPIAMLSGAGTPILAVCSLPRRDHSCAHAADFSAQAQSYGVHSTVLQENLTHEQINEQLGLPGAYTEAVEAFMAELDSSVAAALARGR